MAVGTADRNKPPSCFRISMEDFGCQPAFAAETPSAPEKEGKRLLCRPEHTETKEKFIASALGSVNVTRTRCLSSIILSPLNSNVKMSPHEQGDSHVESEGIAASGSHSPMGAGRVGVRQSRGAARSYATAGQTSQGPLPARQRSGSGTRHPRPPQPPPLARTHPAGRPAPGSLEVRRLQRSSPARQACRAGRLRAQPPISPPFAAGGPNPLASPTPPPRSSPAPSARGPPKRAAATPLLPA